LAIFFLYARVSRLLEPIQRFLEGDDNMEAVAVVLSLFVILWIRWARYSAQERVLRDPQASAEEKRAVVAERRHRSAVNALGCALLVLLGIGWLVLWILNSMN